MPTRTMRTVRAAAAGIVALLLSCSAGFARDRPEITINYAYGTSRNFVLEGRAAGQRGGRAVRATDSWFRNLWRNLRALRVEEQGLPLRLSFAARTWTFHSDGKGYFTLHGDTPPSARPGWNPVHLEAADDTARTDAELLIVPPGDTLGIISDFDDTVIVSEVGDRSRLLEHSLLENHLQRRPVEGMANFYRGILARNPLPEAAPVIYLTASPRQFQPGIRAFLARNGFPPGPIVAKRISGGAGGDPVLDQGAFKTDRIERILKDLPDVRFVLVGDDGEHDPETYRTIRSNHPSRIEAIYIRRVNPDPGRRTYPDQIEPPVAGPAP